MTGRRELKDNLVYGGQAVLEGVMMRSPRHVATAVRRADGSIVVRKDVVTTFSQRHKWARLPFVRGLFALVETLALGIRALNFSAEVAMQDERAADSARGRGEAPTETQEGA
ncbi:MAG: DUF1385 domain-containing protein [Armatimonadota bacterium]